MLFDDGHCVVDGNPCEQGTVYCSDQCRDFDLMENQNVFFNGDEENDPLDSLTESTPYESPDYMDVDKEGSPTYLLYECCLCKTTHGAGAPCSHYSYYKSEPEYLDLNQPRYHSASFGAGQDPDVATAPTILETLKSYAYTDDDLLRKSNLSIQHNYRKWLVMGTN